MLHSRSIQTFSLEPKQTEHYNKSSTELHTVTLWLAFTPEENSNVVPSLKRQFASRREKAHRRFLNETCLFCLMREKDCSHVLVLADTFVKLRANLSNKEDRDTGKEAQKVNKAVSHRGEATATRSRKKSLYSLLLVEPRSWSR